MIVITKEVISVIAKLIIVIVIFERIAIVVAARVAEILIDHMEVKGKSLKELGIR